MITMRAKPSISGSSRHAGVVPEFPGLDGGSTATGAPERRSLDRRPLELTDLGFAACAASSTAPASSCRARRLRPPRRPRRDGRLLQSRHARLRGRLARRLREVLRRAARFPGRPAHGRQGAAGPNSPTTTARKEADRISGILSLTAKASSSPTDRSRRHARRSLVENGKFTRIVAPARIIRWLT